MQASNMSMLLYNFVRWGLLLDSSRVSLKEITIPRGALLLEGCPGALLLEGCPHRKQTKTNSTEYTIHDCTATQCNIRALQVGLESSALGAFDPIDFANSQFGAIGDDQAHATKGDAVEAKVWLSAKSVFVHTCHV
jgi:hypothetical protein